MFYIKHLLSKYRMKITLGLCIYVIFLSFLSFYLEHLGFEKTKLDYLSPWCGNSPISIFFNQGRYHPVTRLNECGICLNICLIIKYVSKPLYTLESAYKVSTPDSNYDK